MFINSINYNTLFSSLSNNSKQANIPQIDFVELSNIRSGLYYQLMKKYAENYNAKGESIKTISTGEIVDESR